RLDQDILETFPQDIETARKLFRVEPSTIEFAACPKCSALYRVDPEKQLQIRCSATRFLESSPCNAVISKLAVKDCIELKNYRVPIRPFTMQDFDVFKASLLSQPGMERLLDRGTRFHSMHDLWDIKDGLVVRDLKCADGTPFVDGFPHRELRLLWSLSIDWFNP